MSGAVAVAALAAAFAVTGLAELARLRRRRRPPRRGRARLLELVGGVGRRLGVDGVEIPRGLDARLVAAGRPLGLRPADAMAVKAGAAALALAGTLPLGSLLPGRLALVAAVAAPAAGFLAPDWWLRRRTRERARAMAAELPDVLDLLRVALGAGLALDRALAEVARRDAGLLAREWRAVATLIELGVPRERALAELVARCPCEGIAPLARALARSLRHGAPLEETLVALAREARAERARRIAERAARAAPQIQLVVALLLVPSVLLLVAAALLASLLA